MVKAVDIYTDMGRFTVAAKHHQTIAEIYESDVADLEKAIVSVERIREYQNTPVEAAPLRLKDFF